MIEENKKVTRFKRFVMLDRLAAWTLLIIIIAYGITGYGMTKGLISQDAARTLHLGWLGGIGLIAFVIHTSWAIHLTFKRHNIWNVFSKILLTAAYISLILFFCWVHFFYQSGGRDYRALNNDIPAGILTSTADTANTVFTAETLKAYNGLNGQSAYVAVDGVVYDMSNVFKNGNHHGYQAGQDLSEAFHAEHPDNFLNGYRIVGSYK